MSYSIDVYRRRMPPEAKLLDFALFVGFFPQLVAGPIVKAIDFIPQLSKRKNLSNVDVRWFFSLFLVGFIKKAVVSDTVAEVVDLVFGAPQQFDSAAAWIATAMYSMQIYCDFSGYSDMAIATAGLLGYSLPENFKFPYASKSITEFWRTWHISLSSWLRDYLYIPLGGNRQGPWRTKGNLMVTMLLGGLWHGAGWNFVIWGGLHGFGLALHKEWGALRTRFRIDPIWPPIGWAATVLFVCFCWVFFRAGSFEFALSLLRTALGESGIGSRSVSPVWLLFLLALPLEMKAVQWLMSRGSSNRVSTVWYAATTGVLWGVTLAAVPRGARPFIYFQF